MSASMTKTTRERLAAAVSILLALLVANVLGDTFRLVSTGDLRSGVLAVSVVAALAAAFGAALGRLRGVHAGRAAAIGALVASLIAFLLLRFPSPWIDMGPFGAGPLTAIAVFLLPLAQLGAVLAVMRWADR